MDGRRRQSSSHVLMAAGDASILITVVLACDVSTCTPTAPASGGGSPRGFRGRPRVPLWSTSVFGERGGRTAGLHGRGRAAEVRDAARIGRQHVHHVGQKLERAVERLLDQILKHLQQDAHAAETGLADLTVLWSPCDSGGSSVAVHAAVLPPPPAAAPWESGPLSSRPG